MKVFQYKTKVVFALYQIAFCTTQNTGEGFCLQLKFEMLLSFLYFQRGSGAVFEGPFFKMVRSVSDFFCNASIVRASIVAILGSIMIKNGGKQTTNTSKVDVVYEKQNPW